jgi:hypothetical protein
MTGFCLALFEFANLDFSSGFSGVWVAQRFQRCDIRRL